MAVYPTFEHRDALGKLENIGRRIIPEQRLVAPRALQECGTHNHGDAALGIKKRAFYELLAKPKWGIRCDYSPA